MRLTDYSDEPKATPVAGTHPVRSLEESHPFVFMACVQHL
jgi:hypothetical protein